MLFEPSTTTTGNQPDIPDIPDPNTPTALAEDPQLLPAAEVAAQLGHAPEISDHRCVDTPLPHVVELEAPVLGNVNVRLDSNHVDDALPSSVLPLPAADATVSPVSSCLSPILSGFSSSSEEQPDSLPVSQPILVAPYPQDSSAATSAAGAHPPPKGPAKALPSLSLSQRLMAAVKDVVKDALGTGSSSLTSVPEMPRLVKKPLPPGERECAVCLCVHPLAAFVTLAACGHSLCRQCASDLFKIPRLGVVRCPFRHRNDREPCDGCIPTALLSQLAPDTLDKLKDIKVLKNPSSGSSPTSAAALQPPAAGLQHQASVIHAPQPLDPDDQGNFDMLMERVRERTVVPWVGAGVSIAYFPLWEGLLRDLWKQKRLQVVPTATDDELNIEFKAFFEGELGRDAPILTDVLGTHRAVVADIVTVFENCIEKLGAKCHLTPGEVAALQAVFVHGVKLEGDNARNWKPEVKAMLNKGLAVHAALVCGPWPVIMTSNWDGCLEASWDFAIPPPSDGDDAAPHPGEIARAICLKSRVPMSVRLRCDASLVFADVKRTQTPPPLLKLHGDFSPRGRAELVAGHAQYRKLMVREVSFCHLLRHVGSRFSFLFYGCSLSDQDLLSSLDDIKENLGAEIGPHFWLTADDVHPERRKFLLRHYSLRVIRMPGRYNFAMLQTYMAHLSKFGWYPPTSKTEHFYQVQPDGCAGSTLSVRLQSARPPPCVDGRRTHIGMTSYCAQNGTCHIGQGVQRELLEMDGAVNDLRYLVFAVGAPHWRALPVPLKTSAPPGHPWRHYLLCEQSAGGSGNPPSVYQAVQDLLHQICTDYPEERCNIDVVLYTIATENSTTLDNSAFNATLSALVAGVAVRHLATLQEPINLNVTLVIPRASSIWGDVHAGVLRPAATLKRAVKGKMAFSCVFPERLEGMLLTDSSEWTCRTVTANIQAACGVGTLLELKQILQVRHFPAGFADSFPILRYVVDGACLQLVPTVVWADIFSDSIMFSNPRNSPVVKWTEYLRVGLPFAVKTLQILRNTPCFAVISSSRFGEALALFAELRTPELQQYFQGAAVIWSKTILADSSSPRKNVRAVAERKRYTDLDVFADPKGSWEAVMSHLGDVLRHTESGRIPPGTPAARAAGTSVGPLASPGSEDGSLPAEHNAGDSS